MGVYRFEDLRVWQAAKRQCNRVGILLKRTEFQRDRQLSEQMNDAALSVMFNITEGFLRRRDKKREHRQDAATKWQATLIPGERQGDHGEKKRRQTKDGTKDPGPRTDEEPRTKDD